MNAPCASRRTPLVRALGACIALLGAAFLAHCNVVVDTSTEQCSTDEDCARKGPGFASTVCTAQKICGSSPCATNAQCTERLGVQGYCRPDRTCTRVFTAECTEIVPADALSKEEVILAGFMGPVQGPFASYGTPLRQGAALALDEIEVRNNGVPGVDGAPRRHLAMLVCHDNRDDDQSKQRPINVARHLVENVQVPIIIGPSYSKITTDVTTEVTAPAGVLNISPSATDPAIAGIDEWGLIWRTVPSDLIQVDALAPLFLLAMDTLYKTGAIKADEPPRVGYAVRQDSYGRGISDEFLGRFPEGGDRRSWGYNVGDAIDWDKAAGEIVQFRPHLFLGFSTTEFVTELLPRIEQRWGSTLPQLHYLLPEGPRVDELLAEVKKKPDLAGRILGTAPGARRSRLFFGFRDRFQLAFRQEPGNLAEFAYDAAYLFAYAVAGAKKQKPTGAELADALRRMSCPDKTLVEANPVNFLDGSRAAAADCVNFDGASGSLDFDNATGEAPSDIALWCPGQDVAGNPIFRVLDSYYDVESLGLVGVPTDGIKFCTPPP